MSRPKLAATACLAASAAGVLLCALAAGTRSRPEAERIREDDEQMAALTERHRDRARQPAHRKVAAFPRHAP